MNEVLNILADIHTRNLIEVGINWEESYLLLGTDDVNLCGVVFGAVSLTYVTVGVTQNYHMPSVPVLHCRSADHVTKILKHDWLVSHVIKAEKYDWSGSHMIKAEKYDGQLVM